MLAVGIKPLDISFTSNYIDDMSSTKSIIADMSTIGDRANRVILDQLKHYGVDDVVPAYGGIFAALFKNNEMSMGEMAQFIERDKSTVTFLVNKMVGLEYLQKRKDASDGRVTLIRLTPKGRALESIFKSISEHLLTTVYKGFTALEKEVLFTLLNRMKNNL